MTRFVSSTNENTSDDAHIRMVTLVDLDFSAASPDGGVVRVHDGLGTLAFGGNTYLGVGNYGSVEGKVEETLDVIAKPIKLILSGVDSALMTAAMGSSYQGGTVTLYLGFLNLSTNEFVADPEVVWEGRMDYMEISFSDKSAELVLNCEHRLRREPRIARYTEEDLQLDYPGDKFFEHLPRIRTYKAEWGTGDVIYEGRAKARHPRRGP